MDVKVAKKIVINGKEYASPDEMPPEIRALHDRAMEVFADRDGNDVPDLLEGKGPGVWKSAKQIWGIAREAQRLGVDHVTLGGGATAGPETKPGEAPHAPSPRSAPAYTPTVSSPLEPTGGGGFRSIVLLVVLIAGALFLGSRLGLF